MKEELVALYLEALKGECVSHKAYDMEEVSYWRGRSTALQDALYLMGVHVTPPTFAAEGEIAMYRTSSGAFTFLDTVDGQDITDYDVVFVPVNNLGSFVGGC